MFRHALIMMLFNTSAKTWHPIYYFEHPMPGPIEEAGVARYKSKGHHTSGFDTREKALQNAEELKQALIGQDNSVVTELDKDLEWDGEGMPTDIQIRPIEYLKRTA